jgi:hypothetical protein
MFDNLKGLGSLAGIMKDLPKMKAALEDAKARLADLTVEAETAGGAVRVAAHLFSDVLAHVAATQNDPQWSEVISIGREDMAVGVGAVGAATIMAVAALADLDSERALTVCVVLALVAIGAITIFATPQHRTSTRLLLSGAAVLLGSVIVLLETTF